MDTNGNYRCVGCGRIEKAHRAFMQRQRDMAIERERLFQAEIDEHGNHSYTTKPENSK